jgi:hypothetical protein
MKCNKYNYLFLQNFLEPFTLVKIRVLQTYTLKMNLVPEIQTDQKRNLETLPSTRPLLSK